jgi:hypothetical protein
LSSTFNTGTAFSLTDNLLLPRQAKGMMLQALMSFDTVALLAAHTTVL